MAREAGSVEERERSERVREPRAHVRARLLDQQGAHVHAARGDRAGMTALEALRVERLVGEPDQRLGLLVRARAHRLAAEPEERQELEPRPRDADAAEQLLVTAD